MSGNTARMTSGKRLRTRGRAWQKNALATVMPTVIRAATPATAAALAAIFRINGRGLVRQA